MTAPLRVGLAGLGTVGRAVVHELLDNADALAARAGRRLDLTRVVSRTPRPEVDLGGAPFDTDLGTLTTGDAVDVIVETIAGEDADAALGAARGLFEAAVAAGRHLVTANKALIALHGNTLLPAAEKAGVRVGFEASVAGGIPILNALTHGLAANRIEWLAGIVNGTSNYILTAMTERQGDFDTALAEAQRKGYAEADPSFDIEGTDAAYKLAILCGLAFHVAVRPDDIVRQGITTLTANDLRHADALGYAIKLLANGRLVDGELIASVQPTLIARSEPLAKVAGVLNAVQVEGDLVGRVVLEGPGAGPGPTASAVLADVLDLARDIVAGRPPVETPPLRKVRVRPPGEHRARRYLRMTVADRPGVLGEIGYALGAHGVSIASVIQVEADEDARTAEIVLTTHIAAGAELEAALDAISASDVVEEICNVIAMAG